MPKNSLPAQQVQLQQADKFAILGRSGCGKSYLCKYIQSNYPRVVIFDTLHEYEDGLIVNDFESFERACLKFESADRFRIIFRLDPMTSNLDEVFKWSLYALYEWGDLQIVLEEVQELTSAHYCPYMLKRCLLTGRHQNISLLFTTQRPGELHKTILSQCGHIYAGQLHEKNDVNYVSGFLGQDAKGLVNLPSRHFLYFRPGQAIEEIELVGNSFKKY